MKAWFARWRVSARIARRQVRRTLRSSVLVVLMVALPVGALGAVAIVVDSSLGTTEQHAAVELGHTEGYLRIYMGPDPSLRQHPVAPEWFRIDYDETANPPTPVHPEQPLLTSPHGELPAGTRVLPVSDPHAIRLETAGGIGAMNAIVGDVGDPVFAGRFDVVAGRAPASDSEIMATQAALDRIGVRIGERVTLTEPAFTGVVTGVVDFAAVPDTRELLFVPWAATDAFGVDAQQVRWYLPDLALSWSDVRELNASGITAYSRAVVLDPPAIDTSEFGGYSDQYWQTMHPMLMVLGAGAVFGAYQVALLAGAAFAVSARRQRQSLATLASVGAEPGEVRRVVLLQGTVLGLAGGVLGLGLGAVAAWVFLRIADTGDRTQFWGYNLPWWLLVAIGLFAVVVGTVAALIPARGAAKADVLEALRGSRKPQRVSVARPVWGSVLLLVGIVLTVGGVLLAVWLTQVGPEVVPWDSPLRSLLYVGIIAGPLLVQVGIIVAGAWLLHLIARGVSRLGLGARLASRDAAANASRSVPAFAAIAAAVFISVFAFSMLGASFSHNAQNHVALAPLGSTYSELWGQTPEQYEEAAEVLTDALQQAGAVDIAVIGRSDAVNAEPAGGLLLPMVAYPTSVLCDGEDSAGPCDLEYYGEHGIAVVDPADLQTVLGIAIPPATMRAYAEGTALATAPALVEKEQVEVGFWRTTELWQSDGVQGPSPYTQNREHAAHWESLPATVIDASGAALALLLAPATAERLGITAVPHTVISSFAEPPSARTIDAINQVGSTLAGGYFWMQVERGPDQPWPWYLLIGGIAGILVFGASAVSIGLARFDGRADDATLAAVGGSRGIRRSISFWQAIVITGIGALTGAATGLLPSWGFVEISPGLRVADFPWPLIAGLAVGLPLLVAVTAWLVSPRPAVLTRRTAIT